MGAQPVSLRKPSEVRLNWAVPLIPVALAVFCLSALSYYHVSMVGSSPDGVIATPKGLMHCGFNECTNGFNVIVRCDGGVGLPDPAVADSVLEYRIRWPIVLIDFNDRHHRQLQRWSK